MAGLVLWLAPAAAAFDFHLGNQPLRLDLTESMFLSAHLDSGIADPTQINYGELLNRLNAQLAWKSLLFMVRFDSGAWFHTPSPGGSLPQNPLCHQTPPPAICTLKTDANGNVTDFRLNDHFRSAGKSVYRSSVPLGVSAFYLEKIALSYSGRTIEATLGDFYVNFGRGLVLSIRKIDELGVDTTITGAKVALHRGDLSAIALAGFTNMQNIDQATARFVPDSNDFITAAHVDYRFFDRVLVGAHAMFGLANDDTGNENCAGGKCPEKPYYLRPGVMLDAPRLLSWLGLYAEYARAQDRLGAHGNAFYAAANVFAGRTDWLLEVKDYDNYRPWHASSDPLKDLVYQQPPTLERVITQINENINILAGRLRLDVRANPSLDFYASAELGRSHPGGSANQDTLVDFYGGANVRWDQGRSHFFPLLGYRHERDDVIHDLEERLVAVEWDGAQFIGRGFSVETSGQLWFRRKPASSNTDWREGFVYLSVKWSPRLVLSGGYEFTTLDDAQNSTHNFFNGQLKWNITPATSLAFFYGGLRPGLKCISGVCRVFPAFQGASLEFVLRL